MKKLLKKICAGVGMGCFAFVATLFIASAFAGGADAFLATRSGEGWLRLAACFVIISTGFYVPSLIYDDGRIALWLRTTIHLLAGTAVYLLTACFAGWMKAGVKETALYLLLALGIAAVIWLCIYFHIRAQAERINRRIREGRQDERAEKEASGGM